MTGFFRLAERAVSVAERIATALERIADTLECATYGVGRHKGSFAVVVEDVGGVVVTERNG